jgi:uncharacterized protein YndB with AHSA1/START domain/DNA-binding transcriptional ArsR family regulator
MDEVFHALADPTRRALLDRLYAKNGQSLSELCTDMGMTRQAVTQHLALLEAANLTTSVWHGREKLHYLNPAPLHEIYERWLAKFDRRQLEALSELKQSLEAAERGKLMSKPKFVYVTYIGTTPERLWDALTQGEFTKKYWYGRRIESDWQIGSPVRFFDGDSDDLTDSGVVLESDPPGRLAYTFQNEFDPEARKLGHSRVTFTIQAHQGMVKLTLIHDELPTEEVAEGFREGWAPILSSLKTFLESGQPLPQLQSLEEQGRARSAKS